MRSISRLFLALLLLLTVAVPNAQAVGCWVCAHAYDTCLYYAETNYDNWRNGCETMYAHTDPRYIQCIVQGDARWSNDVAQCEQQQSDCEGYCEPRGPRENCPLVIDLEQHGVRFTSAANGVNFDIDADGAPNRIAWTDPDAGDGFLVWDRNNNGVIDSGRELFGNSSPQPPSADANGFLALATLDAANLGGNEDGTVDASDRAWRFLRIWVDADHDGASGPGELHALSDSGITAFDTDYRESRRKDRYGNELRFRSRAIGDKHFRDVIDVFFTSLP
jgi:hypothetical protein